MTTGSIFWVVVFAVSGGALVFIGLLLERFSEKDWHKNVSDFRRCKSRNKLGEGFVIIGIAIEIVVGIISAVDAWQTRQMAIKADWRNQRIAEISAVVNFDVKEDVFAENSLWGDPKRIASILLCETNLILNNHFEGFSQLGFLDADKFERAGDEKKLTYILHFYRSFDEDFFLPSLERQTNTVEWVLKNIRFLDIETKFLPHDAEIIGGSAVITINSSQQKWFNISPQKDLSSNSGKIGWGYQVIASTPSINETITNSTRVSNKK